MDIASINAYGYVIGASLIIIISYFFNLVAEKWNIPSVLLLIGLGIVIRAITGITHIEGNSDILSVLGVVGLIMIVLEASLDLELKKDKIGLILKSFGVAVIALSLTSSFIAFIFHFFLDIPVFTAFIYGIPLSIMSSAIIIPSVSSLPEDKKEFMIYESTFSDILGIMFFYFMLGSTEFETLKAMSMNIVVNILLTVVISIVLSYVLIYLFQKIKTEVKLFLTIAVLILLYTVGKMMHLSSLIIILFFGLILNNRELFFRGFIKKYIDESELKKVFNNFKTITIESAFVVRTFFFVIFGMTIALSTLFSIKVLYLSLAFLVAVYGIRYLSLLIFIRKNFSTELFIAPRGLITILLFFAIPEEYQVPDFETGVLLSLIIASSIIMAVALIKYKKQNQNVEPETEVDAVEYAHQTSQKDDLEK